jgi:hypothetical protein
VAGERRPGPGGEGPPADTAPEALAARRPAAVALRGRAGASGARPRNGSFGGSHVRVNGSVTVSTPRLRDLFGMVGYRTIAYEIATQLGRSRTVSSCPSVGATASSASGGDSPTCGRQA